MGSVLHEKLARHVRQQFRRSVGDGDGLGAVSYTHLRAHETVLDLVCRLLLEKKKNQKKKKKKYDSARTDIGTMWTQDGRHTRRIEE